MRYGLPEHTIKAMHDIFARFPNLEKVIIYGSRAKGTHRPNSDIDLTLVGEELDLSEQFKMETMLDDLLLPYKIDLSIYHQIDNPDLLEHMERVGEVFWEQADTGETNNLHNNGTEWNEVKSGDVLDLISGYAFKSKDFKKFKEENVLPVIKIKNVANGDVNFDDVVYHEVSDKLNKYILEEGNVLIAMTGNHPHAKTQVVGDVSRYKLKEKALLNQRVGKLVPKDNNCLDFFYYYFKDKDNRNYLANQSSGSANQANLSKGTILSVSMLIPEPAEQRAIASVLSSLDDKIDLLHRQNKTLEQMAEALFRQWFVEEAEEEWEDRPLSSVATFLNGLACQKYPPKNELEKLPVLKIKQLRNGISEDCDWCTTEVDEKYVVENGDIIFSWSASLMVKIWEGETCILNQHLFKVSSDEFPKWYIYLWSKLHLDRFVAIAKAHATTMGHIKRGDLDEARVLVPSEDELNSMTTHFSPLIKKIIENNKQIRTLTSLRDTLLPKLMNGEIRIKTHG